MGDLTHVCLGDPGVVPEFGDLLVRPRSKPHAAALYAARLAAANAVRTPYMSLLDGGDDVLLPGYWDAMHEAVRVLRLTGCTMACTRETINGGPGRRHPHHGVVIDTRAFAIEDWPTGCYHFETVVHGRLAQRCTPVEINRTVYDWRPGGASQWPSTVRALINSRLWLAGRPGVHFDHDMRMASDEALHAFVPGDGAAGHAARAAAECSGAGDQCPTADR